MHQTQRIYYTGDMANISGWFTAETLPSGVLKLTEEPGPLSHDRIIMIHAVQVGEVYQGHSVCFVTEAAYRAYRAARSA